MNNDESSVYKTSDLSLTAYLVMKGLVLVKATKCEDGKFEFVLEDYNNISGTLTIEYLNSDCSKFDHNIRKIKKFLYSK